MSKYTTEIHHIMESGFDLGLKDYPIFSEEYREKLNTKIINHYLFHEIGFETVPRFKHYLNTTMSEIMPYYNKLYESELLKINPLLTFERKKDFQKNAVSESEGTNKVESVKDNDNVTTQISNNKSNLVNNTDSSTHDVNSTISEIEQDTNSNTIKDNNVKSITKGKDIFSDTPKSLIQSENIDTNFYATNVTAKDNENTSNDTEILNSAEGVAKNENTSTDSISTSLINNTGETTTNTTINGSEKLNETTSVNGDNKNTLVSNESNIVTENGFEVPLTDLIVKYRETFLNIDMLIINELKDLFMMIY